MDDKDFKRIKKELREEKIRLLELPVENPILSFRQVSICLHSVSFSSPFPKESLADDRARSQFKSFEPDLLSYRFQSDPPLMSRCLMDRPRQIMIHYPDRLEYITEGHRIPLYCLKKEQNKPARACLSQTYFHQSGIYIYHLVISPREGAYFSEYDLIKLSKIYGGIQESNNLRQAIRFAIDENDEKGGLLLVEDFIGDLLNRERKGRPFYFPENDKPILCAGSIEIDVDSIVQDSYFPGLFDKIVSSFSNEIASREDLENAFKSNSNVGRELKALCGIVTGIFDFNRMSFVELLDTLEATVQRGGTFIRIHRGNLIRMDHKDQMLDSCRNTIGANPNIIIPQAILLQNDAVVDLADKQLNEALRMGQNITKKNRVYRDKLTAIRFYANRRLRLNVLPNVFQYSTERQIMDEGARHRGSNERIISSIERLRELESMIEKERDRQEKRSNATLAILTAFLSGVMFQPVLFSIIDDWYEKIPSQGHLIGWGAYAAVVVLFGIFLYRTIRSIKKTEI
jgi:hypothetical protein